MSTILTFGKYKSKEISEVPSDYLAWVVDSFDKTQWVNVAIREMIARGEADAIPDLNDPSRGLAVRYQIGGTWKMRSVAFSMLAADASAPDMPMDPTTLPPSVQEFTGDVKSGYAMDMLRQEAKVRGPFRFEESAQRELSELFPNDLLVFGMAMKHAEAEITREACIYGKLSREKWVTERVKCEVELSYLNRCWTFAVESTQIPILAQVE